MDTLQEEHMTTIASQTALASNGSAARPFYTRLAALGFALIALTGLVSTVYALITGGNMDSLDFILALLVIGLLLAGALMRFGAWTHVIAALLSFLLLATVLPFSLFILQHPEDASNFIPLVLLFVGAALGFVGSIASLVQRRRHTARTAATRAESLAVKLLLALLVLVAAASVALTVSARTTLSAEAKTNALAVEIKSFSFNPNRLQVKAGDTVRIVVKNSDPTLHTFTLPDAGVDVSVPPGSERLVEFRAPRPGEYRWYCIPHSDPGPNGTRTGMVGVLTVQ
jgi:nitrite reductase (NO-forming)